MAQKAGESQAPATIEPRVRNRRRALQLLGSLAAVAGAAAMAAGRPDPASANTGSYSDTQSGPVLSSTNSGTGAAISGLNNVGSPINGSPGVVGESFNGIGVYGISGNSTYGGVFGQNNASGPGVSGASSSGPGVQGTTSSNNGYGVYGQNTASGPGVYGTSSTGYGVQGTTSSSNSYGVYGQNTASGPGVYGTSSSGYGVQGQGSGIAAIFGDNSGTGTGVLGANGGAIAFFANSGVSGTAGTNGVGVGGFSTGTGSYGVFGESDTGTGVLGQTSSSASAGVEGQNFGSGPGVRGQNLSGGIGVWGVTTNSGQGLANPAVAGTNTGGGAALVGFTAGPSSIGLGGATNAGVGVYGSSTTGAGVAGYTSSGVAVGGTATGGGIAGYFSGPVFVNGSLTVTGGAKSAAVRSNGSLKRVYSLECPESWFEDFGSGQLSGGQATVSLEPGFASIVHTDTYRVFLTPRGESKGWLYISKQSPNGFTVQEATGGTSNIAFDYRVVAKRADIAGARLEDVAEPPSYYQPPEPALDHAPKPPELPTMPQPISRPGG
jgi:hypothetical protein